MSNTAIKVENLSKVYRLGEIGTGSIGQDVDRWFKTKILGKEDPFLMIGETNDRANKGKSDIVYSLQDINFEIQQGDAVGIIGRNGAGKSTLLKILSRVTTPTTGRINIKGRVASLLEVGTGFHPELTGRENIYLNGAILGMRKREIDRKLDEIIDFSGVERYIDTPVKRYSSGMYVRLAFAVAAHLESEILIVDEVLAVGDAEFQKKCLGKMGEVSKGEGRTVLFVSHNMAAVQSLCGKGILMENGQSSVFQNINSLIDGYNNTFITKTNEISWEIEDAPQDDFFIVKSVRIFQENEMHGIFYIENETKFSICFRIKKAHPCFKVSIGIYHQSQIVFVADSDDYNKNEGEMEIVFVIPKNFLNNKRYSISFGITKNFNQWDIQQFDIMNFECLEKNSRTGYVGEIIGAIRPEIKSYLKEKK